VPKDDDWVAGACCLLIIVIAVVYYVWVSAPWVFYLAFALLLALSVAYVYRWYQKQQREEQLLQQEQKRLEEERRKREQFIQEQRAQGHIQFIDNTGVERWGTPEQVRQWKREEEEHEMRKKGVLVERETIIREVVKVRCRYCGKLYDEGLDKCPHCAASR